MKKEEQKKKIKSITKILVILIVMALIVGIVISVKYIKGIELMQLSPQSHSQMMGYLIKTKNNKIIAIDGGTIDDTTNFINEVNNLGGKIDYWFITHPHKDHAGVFNEIIANHPEIEIGKVYYTANDIEWYKEYDEVRSFEAENFYTSINSEKLKDKVEEVTLNQKIKIDNVECEILGIKNPEITENPINNSSMILKMNVNDKSIIFLGDAGAESGQKLLNTQKEKLKADILQMAHHGQAGVNEDVYQAIKPKICLWPTPDWLWNNDLGGGYNTAPYKTIETRSWIEKLDVKQNIIAKDGDITIKVW